MEFNPDTHGKDLNEGGACPPASSFVCRKCQTGQMQPAVESNEIELTDTYICNHCGHRAIIPSPLIIFSQLLCGLLGGLVAGYLFIQEMSALMTSVQFNLQRDMASNTLLMIASSVFLAGFGYTLYHGFLGMTIRRLYSRYPNTGPSLGRQELEP